MKKLIIVLTVLVFSAFYANAQLKVGVNGGLPIGAISDFYKFTFGVDGYYLFGNNPDAFLKFGGAAGYQLYFGDEVDILGTPVEFDNASFLTLAGVMRITLFKTLTFGPDLGYAIGLNEGNDGGFYVRSVLGIDIANRVELNGYYHLVTVDGGNFDSVGLGLLFEFGPRQ